MRRRQLFRLNFNRSKLDNMHLISAREHVYVCVCARMLGSTTSSAAAAAAAAVFCSVQMTSVTLKLDFQRKALALAFASQLCLLAPQQRRRLSLKLVGRAVEGGVRPPDVFVATRKTLLQVYSTMLMALLFCLFFFGRCKRVSNVKFRNAVLTL